MSAPVLKPGATVCIVRKHTRTPDPRTVTIEKVGREYAYWKDGEQSKIRLRDMTVVSRDGSIDIGRCYPSIEAYHDTVREARERSAFRNAVYDQRFRVKPWPIEKIREAAAILGINLEAEQ